MEDCDFRYALRNLKNNQSSIQKFTEWIKENDDKSLSQFYESWQIVWKETIRSKNDENILLQLYVLNDVLQRTKVIPILLEDLVESIFSDSFQTVKSEKIQNSIHRLIRLWMRRKIFDLKLLTKIENDFFQNYDQYKLIVDEMIDKDERNLLTEHLLKYRIREEVEISPKNVELKEIERSSLEYCLESSTRLIDNQNPIDHNKIYNMGKLKELKKNLMKRSHEIDKVTNECYHDVRRRYELALLLQQHSETIHKKLRNFEELSQEMEERNKLIENELISIDEQMSDLINFDGPLPDSSIFVILWLFIFRIFTLHNGTEEGEDDFCEKTKNMNMLIYWSHIRSRSTTIQYLLSQLPNYKFYGENEAILVNLSRIFRLLNEISAEEDDMKRVECLQRLFIIYYLHPTIQSIDHTVIGYKEVKFMESVETFQHQLRLFPLTKFLFIHRTDITEWENKRYVKGIMKENMKKEFLQTIDVMIEMELRFPEKVTRIEYDSLSLEKLNDFLHKRLNVENCHFKQFPQLNANSKYGYTSIKDSKSINSSNYLNCN
ncbi:hypothetical protein SNEBB_003465 [Seison nebaliae]|nr:hypothetical protein SNEBB_003465 [Seison nebaliae]